MKKIPCIGGPLHGEIVEIVGLEYHHAIYNGIPTVYRATAADIETALSIFVYTLRQFYREPRTKNNETVALYVHESATAEQLRKAVSGES